MLASVIDLFPLNPCRFITSFVTLFAVVIAITKDLPDVEGDRANGIETFATRMGVRNVTFLSEFGFCVRGFWSRFRAAEGLAVVLLGSASSIACLIVRQLRRRVPSAVHSTCCSAFQLQNGWSLTQSSEGCAGHRHTWLQGSTGCLTSDLQVRACSCQTTWVRSTWLSCLAAPSTHPSWRGRTDCWLPSWCGGHGSWMQKGEWWSTL